MDAATIEETNRVRVSLGMKPLPVPGASSSNGSKVKPAAATPDTQEAGSTLESRQAQAYDNYKKHQDAEAAKKQREERAAAIRKARDKAQRFAGLEGEGLGEGPDVDAKTWLKGLKKQQKKVEKARKLEEELFAAEAAAAAAVQYTSKDLAGIKVAHDMAEFLDGPEQILTLKDATIDENEEEGDELENINLREQEKRSERLDLKKKRLGYDPNDDDEHRQGEILAQYDDEINGKKSKTFTLNDSGAIDELADILGEPPQKANNVQVSLDDVIENIPMSSDYVAQSEIKVKKPKKKKSKGLRQKHHDEDDLYSLPPAQQDSSAMEVYSGDATSTSKRSKAGPDSFVDDDDLQASLALQRQRMLRKRKKIKPEDIAKQLKEEDEAEAQAGGQDNSGGLVISEVTEFISGLRERIDGDSDNSDDEDRKPKAKRRSNSTPPTAAPPEDHIMAEAPIKEEDDEGSRPASPPHDPAGVEEEKAIDQGMGATVALLRSRGLIKEATDTAHATLRDRQEFLSRKRHLEEELDDQTRQQRERDRKSGRLDRMSVREREDYARQQNQWRDQQQSRRMAELFSASYKPSVQLKYTDEHGRSLDQKEAFKHLSHQFHGKGSGKGKTEKRLKKIEDEKRREAQSLFDASANSGMSAATAQQIKKRREAGVRLG